MEEAFESLRGKRLHQDTGGVPSAVSQVATGENAGEYPKKWAALRWAREVYQGRSDVLRRSSRRGKKGSERASVLNRPGITDIIGRATFQTGQNVLQTFSVIVLHHFIKRSSFENMYIVLYVISVYWNSAFELIVMLFVFLFLCHLLFSCNILQLLHVSLWSCTYIPLEMFLKQFNVLC